MSNPLAPVEANDVNEPSTGSTEATSSLLFASVDFKQADKTLQVSSESSIFARSPYVEKMPDAQEVTSDLVPRTGSLTGLGTDKKPLKPEKPKSSDMIAISKGDRVDPPPTNEVDAKKQYMEVLKAAGVENPEHLASKTFDQIHETFQTMDKHGGTHKGNAVDQMARLTRAMTQILKTSRGTGDPLGINERKLLVADMALNMSDPERFANQGNHATCVLLTIQKQLMRGGDPARFAEHLTMIANQGFTVVKGLDGKPLTLNIDSRSLVPDDEARIDPQRKLSTGGDHVKNIRGMAGLLGDAFVGQLAAQLKDPRYHYVSSNLRGFGIDASRGMTNEGLVQHLRSGSYQFLGQGPRLNALDLDSFGKISQILGLPEGNIFLRDSAGPVPLEFDRYFSFHQSWSDLHKGLTAFQNKHGMPGHLVTEPSWLNGYYGALGFHSLNIKAEPNKILFDNHWGSLKDFRGSIN